MSEITCKILVKVHVHVIFRQKDGDENKNTHVVRQTCLKYHTSCENTEKTTDMQIAKMKLEGNGPFDLRRCWQWQLNKK